MKRSLFVVVVFALLFCFSGGVFADAAIYDYNYGTVTDCSYDVYVATVDGGVNLREAPTTESAIICTIPDFVQLHISAESSAGNGWGYTTYNGYSGWVALSQVSDHYPVSEASYYVSVTAADGVNHRDGPYTSYALLANIPYGTELYVDATYNGWAGVGYNGLYGWIALSQVTAVEEMAEDAPEQEPMPIAEEPVEEESAVTSLEKEESGGIPIMTLLMGMIILVIVIAAVLIIVIVVKKK